MSMVPTPENTEVLEISSRPMIENFPLRLHPMMMRQPSLQDPEYRNWVAPDSLLWDDPHYFGAEDCPYCSRGFSVWCPVGARRAS